MCAGAAYLVFTFQGLLWLGGKKPQLLQRILQTAAECLSFLFFFLRNFSYSSPSGPNKHLMSHTAQPGSLPRILQQTLRLGRASAALVPELVPGTLLSLSTLLTI